MWCVVFKSLRVTLRFIVTVAAIAKEVGTHTCSAAAESPHVVPGGGFEKGLVRTELCDQFTV